MRTFLLCLLLCSCDLFAIEVPPTAEQIAFFENKIRSLRPLASPEPPAVRDESWALNEIDRFVLARVEQAGLKPAGAATMRGFIRRATYDLLGLPPAPEDVKAFVSEAGVNEAAAISKLIERKTMGIGGGLSNQQRVLLKPGWEFRPGGKCGTLVSDLFPYLREQMDDVCLIRSMKSDDNEHYNATLGIHTGSFFFSRPGIGAWVSYGLGTVNQNLPSFVVLAPQMP